MEKQKNVLTVSLHRGRAARVPIDCPRPPEASAGLAKPGEARGGGESRCKLGGGSGVLISRPFGGTCADLAVGGRQPNLSALYYISLSISIGATATGSGALWLALPAPPLLL